MQLSFVVIGDEVLDTGESKAADLLYSGVFGYGEYESEGIFLCTPRVGDFYALTYERLTFAPRHMRPDKAQGLRHKAYALRLMP